MVEMAVSEDHINLEKKLIVIFSNIECVTDKKTNMSTNKKNNKTRNKEVIIKFSRL